MEVRDADAALEAGRATARREGVGHARAIPAAVSLIRGAFIAESLRPGSAIEGLELTLTRCSRYDVRDVPAYQPSTWTLIEFEASASVDRALADVLADALLEPGWYANWNSDAESTVVYPGRIFRYPRFDRAGRDVAAAYGREKGVPESQLDWGD